MKSFFHAVATLSGLIIGVGIFGVPYVTSHAGFGVGMIWILLVGAVVLAVHLLYGEVVSGTSGTHRLPGYIGRLLGVHAKKTVLIIEVIRFWAIQIAYIIVGGIFLRAIIGPWLGGSAMPYSFALFTAVALATFFGLKLVDRIEFFLAWFEIAAVLFIAAYAWPFMNMENLAFRGTGDSFMPYGVVMVSLAGAAAIPQIWDITGRNKKIFRWAIVVGTLIPIILTALFAAAVVGVSGAATSQEAVAGLRGVLGNEIVWFGAWAGLLAVFTSYLVIALYLQEMLKYDFRVKHTPAWAFAVGVPIVLYLAGAQNFIHVIDIVGSLFFGIEGILIVTAAIIIAKRRNLGPFRLKLIIGVIAGLLLTLGVIQKLLHLF